MIPCSSLASLSLVIVFTNLVLIGSAVHLLLLPILPVAAAAAPIVIRDDRVYRYVGTDRPVEASSGEMEQEREDGGEANDRSSPLSEPESVISGSESNISKSSGNVISSTATNGSHLRHESLKKGPPSRPLRKGLIASNESGRGGVPAHLLQTLLKANSSSHKSTASPSVAAARAPSSSNKSPDYASTDGTAGDLQQADHPQQDQIREKDEESKLKQEAGTKIMVMDGTDDAHHHHHKEEGDGPESSVAQRTGIPDRIFIQITNLSPHDPRAFLHNFVDGLGADDDMAGDNATAARAPDPAPGLLPPDPDHRRPINFPGQKPHHHSVRHQYADDDDGDDGVHRLHSSANEVDYDYDGDPDRGDEEGEGMHVESLFRGYGGGSSGVADSSSSDSGSSSSTTTSRGSGGGSGGTTRQRPRVIYNAMITSPAGCEAEMRTVEIKDSVKSNELYYPWCVRIARCSGCCPSSRLHCVPTNVSIVQVNAVKLHFAQFNERFRYGGMRTFHLEKHESCRCECVQQSSDCNQRQEYRPDECRCACRDPEQELSCIKHNRDKVWHQDTCECKCRHRLTCMTGTVFSDETCRCLVSHETSRFSFHQFPLIRFHSSIDLEIKKQQDFGTNVGSSVGIDPDLGPEMAAGQHQHATNQFVLQDESSGGGAYERESNHLMIMPPHH